MAEKKSELIKSIMVNLGILLILVSTTVSLGPAYFFLGLMLLVIQTLDFKGMEPKKLVTAEIIIAATLAIATVVQLIMSKTFGQQQVFMILLLLGAILVVVEAARKYADL